MQSQDKDEGFIIVGGGRVGNALFDMGAGKDKMVKRGESIENVRKTGQPIIVCTRNNDLQGVVDSTPADRRKDLVFIQNGMLQPWLDSNGLGDNTQVLVYFAVARMGDKPTDGITDLNPEGLTAAYGVHAESVASRLRANNLSCNLPQKDEFLKAMLEKLLWIATFMLVGARHACNVGEVEQKYREEVGQLCAELGPVGEQFLGIKLDDQTLDRMCAYARSVAHFPTAVKEFEWRNGFFYEFTKQALEKGQADPCPTHTAWLKEINVI